MIFNGLTPGVTIDTQTTSWKLLRGLVFYVDRHPFHWVHLNGTDSIVRLVRSVRAEAFKRREKQWGHLLAIMNRLDPPNCRCGRKGTRIIGSVSFCTTCGPSDRQRITKRWYTDIKDTAAAERSRRKKEFDDQEHAKDRFHRNSAVAKR